MQNTAIILGRGSQEILVSALAVYRVSREIVHINLVGSEENMKNIISSFKYGVSLNVRSIGHHQRSTISHTNFEMITEKDNDSGCINVIFQKKNLPTHFFLFSSSNDVCHECNRVRLGNMDLADLDCGNLDVKLFNHIYKNTGIPIIEEWMKYIIYHLYTTYKLQYVSRSVRQDCIDKFPNLYVVNCSENDIIDIISTGLSSGKLTINGKEDQESSTLIKNITSLDSYMNTFSEILAQKIKDKFRPLFIPEQEQYDEKLQKMFDFSEYHAGIQLYEPQKAVIQASIRNLREKDSVFIVSETGSGKTAMGINVALGHTKKQNPVITVMCPGHLVPNWKREIMRFSTFSDIRIIRSLKDFIKIEHMITDKTRQRPLWIIFSKDSVKTEYEKQPIAIFKRKSDWDKNFYCPECGKEIPGAEKHNFVKETSNNTRCPSCKAPLWTNVNISGKSKWFKLKGVGWMNKDMLASEETAFLEYDPKDESKYAPMFVKTYKRKINLVQDFLKAEEKDAQIEHNAIRVFPVAKYIHQRYKNKIDYAIFDEVHQLTAKNSCQGKAFAHIISAAKKTIALTGTLVNGYAQGLYYALYRCFSSKMKEAGYAYKDVKEFEKDYGVYETIRHFNLEDYHENRAPFISKTKILPGINPLVFTEFLMENAVFLSLSSLSENMPNLEEIPIGIDLETELRSNYSQIRNNVATFFSTEIDSGSYRVGYTEKLLQFLHSYPDSFTKNKDLEHHGKKFEMERFNIEDKNFVSNKEKELISLVTKKVTEGEKVLVYTHWTGSTDINDRLKKLLEKKGFRVSILTQKIDVFEREDWIRAEVEKGLDVLICNPKLVETGLNLLDFTTIVFYQLWRNLFTMRQGSRRSWRLSQEKDISIYYMYYKNTIQEQIVSIMATKLKASLLAEGKFDEEGLSAMSDGMDVLNKLAESVVSDINYSIDENIFGKQEYRKHAMTQTIRHLPTPNCPIHYFNSLKKMKKNKYDLVHEELFRYCI